MSGSNTQQVLSMFNSGSTSAGNPVVSQLISRVATSLASKFGISPQITTQIASSVLPKVMSQFVNKSKDPNDKTFDLSDVISKLGGSNANIGDLIGNVTGSSDKGGIGGALGKMFGG